MSKLSKTINGQKKTILNNETNKEEEVIFLYSSQINNNQGNTNENIGPPKSICEFILKEKLGEGTFGTVRLAINRQTGEKVAIKILEKSRISNYDDKKRLEREIKILTKIHHPNIVKLFCVIETGSQIFIIMEYIKGNELFQHILVKKKLEEEEAFYFFIQIINCIEYLHKLKIAHRDLKAENIIIEQRTKEIKIIDFGLSNIYEESQILLTACGSPIYAAPEMLEGKSYKGSTVDIWSAGIILYYMLCGDFPFEDSSNDKLYKKILKGKFKMPKFLSKNAKDLISKILVVIPQKRINIKDIKKHPWVLKFIEKDNKYKDIFKSLGLNSDKYIIPIDEDIVNEINNKYKVEKEIIRKNILCDIVSDISTLYYLMLNKKTKDGIKSVADMKSDLFEAYIQDKNNLLSSYKNDINLVVEKRKYGPNEIDKKTEDVDNEKKIEESKEDNNIDINEDNNDNTLLNKKDIKCTSAEKLNNKMNLNNLNQNDINKNSVINKRVKNTSNDFSSKHLTLKNNNSEKKKLGQYSIAEDEKTKLENMKKKLMEKKQQIAYDYNSNKIRYNSALANNNKAKNKIKLKKDKNNNNNINFNKEKKENKKKNLNKNELLKSNSNKVIEINNEKNENNDNKDISNKEEIKKEDSNNINNNINENKINDQDSNNNINNNITETNKENNDKDKDKEIESNKNYSSNDSKKENLIINKDKNKTNISKNTKPEKKIIINKTKKEGINNYKKLKREISLKENKKISGNKTFNKNNIINNNNNNINKKKEPFHHKKNSSTLIGKSSVNIGINNDKGIKKSIKRNKNKSVDIDNNNAFKKDIHYEKLINNKEDNKFKNNKMKLIHNKVKSPVYTKTPSASISSPLSTSQTNLNKKKPINNFIPFDINNLFIKDENKIKNEIMKLSEKNNFKVKVQKKKFNIVLKNNNVIEFSVEKIDDLLNVIKFKKLQSKNEDIYIQINNILNELNIIEK